MARIRGQNTAPELRLRQALWRTGFRFRLRKSDLPFRPDFVLGSVAVFVDGCFWHGCPHHYVPPRSTIAFWARKLALNVERDRRQTLALEAQGWRVLRFWECEVIESLDQCVASVKKAALGQRCRSGRAWRVARVEWLDDDRSMERRWLQDLRDPGLMVPRERRRITAKARFPKRSMSALSGTRARVLPHGERGR